MLQRVFELALNAGTILCDKLSLYFTTFQVLAVGFLVMLTALDVVAVDKCLSVLCFVYCEVVMGIVYGVSVWQLITTWNTAGYKHLIPTHLRFGWCEGWGDLFLSQLSLSWDRKRDVVFTDFCCYIFKLWNCLCWIVSFYLVFATFFEIPFLACIVIFLLLFILSFIYFVNFSEWADTEFDWFVTL